MFARHGVMSNATHRSGTKPRAFRQHLLPQSYAAFSGRHSWAMSPYGRAWLHALVALLCLVFVLHQSGVSLSLRGQGEPTALGGPIVAGTAAPVLVSYSYFEKDSMQRANMEFFVAAGMGLDSRLPQPRDTDFVVVISGEACAPCKALLPHLARATNLSQAPEVAEAWESPGLTILQRKVCCLNQRISGSL